MAADPNRVAAATPRRLRATVTAALLMLAMAFCYGVTANIGRVMAEALNPMMVTLLRNGFGLLMILPLVIRLGPRALRTQRPGLYLLRSAFNLIGLLAWFWALPHVLLADAIALQFTGPLFLALGAVLFLGEQIGPPRAAALAVGFAGALLILQPGFDETGLAMIALVVASALWAGMGLFAKELTRTDSTEQIVVLNLAIMLPFSLGLALLDWQWPSIEMWLLGAGLGGFAAGAHLFMTRAFHHADASFCMAFDFARLPFAAAIAFVLFDQVPGVWTMMGAVVIFAATLYVTLRDQPR